MTQSQQWRRRMVHYHNPQSPKRDVMHTSQQHKLRSASYKSAIQEYLYVYTFIATTWIGKAYDKLSLSTH